MGPTRLNNSINAEECNRNLVTGAPFDVQEELPWMGDNAHAKPRVSFAAIEQESARSYDSLLSMQRESSPEEIKPPVGNHR